MARYEPIRTGEEHHHHLVCDNCGTVTPFTDPELEIAIRKLEAASRCASPNTKSSSTATAKTEATNPARLTRAALTFQAMCAGCVMAAATGATGARTWLQAQHMTWLTPRILRATTIALFVGAFGFSSITLSGSTAAYRHHSPPPALHSSR